MILKQMIVNILLILIVFTTSSFASILPQENYVLLREYVDRLIVEQNRYIDTRFNAIENMFVEKQRALEVGATVLDAKFVKIDEFIKRSSEFDSALAGLSSRVTILETQTLAQREQAAFQKEQAAALIAKWGLLLGVLFAVMQILIAAFFSRRKERS